MASFAIHLAVAKIYLDHNLIQNKKEFIKGIIEPDLQEDKNKSHYSDDITENTLVEILQKKVNLKKYLNENEVESDYKKGEFLHLLTDYEFFNHFLKREYIEQTSYETFFKELYRSYDETNFWLKKQYPIEIYEYKKILSNAIAKSKVEKSINEMNGKNILETEPLVTFIENLGRVDFQKKKKEFI